MSGNEAEELTRKGIWLLPDIANLLIGYSVDAERDPSGQLLIHGHADDVDDPSSMDFWVNVSQLEYYAGVYFIFRRRFPPVTPTLDYIGKSSNFKNRLRSHKQRGDTIFFFAPLWRGTCYDHSLDAKQSRYLDSLERTCISAFSPAGNTLHVKLTDGERRKAFMRLLRWHKSEVREVC